MKDYKRIPLNEYIARKELAVKQLGGKCAQCDWTDPRALEFDHIDPSTKLHNISDLIGLQDEEALSIELPKCQLLCKNHHCIKTYDNHDKQKGRIRKESQRFNTDVFDMGGVRKKRHRCYKCEIRTYDWDRIDGHYMCLSCLEIEALRQGKI